MIKNILKKLNIAYKKHNEYNSTYYYISDNLHIREDKQTIYIHTPTQTYSVPNRPFYYDYILNLITRA